MALIELPNGDFIDPKTVRGVRTIIDYRMGPRVLLDTTIGGGLVTVDFDIPEAARQWAKEFAGKVNVAEFLAGLEAPANTPMK